MSGNACVLVIGPAGVGKSTLCSTLIEYAMTIKRKIHLVNLDPAAEHFPVVVPTKDIKECVSLEEVMADTELGPNGGLVFCMETLLDNLEEWLDLDQQHVFESDFLMVDCPGQIELFTHYTFINDIVKVFQNNGYSVCVLYCLESSFILDPFKFLSGTLNALSAMARIQAPHINVLTKADLLDQRQLEAGDYDIYLNVDPSGIEAALTRQIEEHSMVKYMPIDNKDEDSILQLYVTIDHVLQFEESQEPREPQNCDNFSEQD